MTDSDRFWVLTVISLSVLLQVILLVILCLFRRKSYTPEVLDESSCLIFGSYRSFEENSPTSTGFDDVHMTLQYYVRGIPRLEYLNSYKSHDTTANLFWFTVRDKALAKSRNKGRLFPMSSGNCVAKVKQQPKLGGLLKSKSSFGVALDILLTIKDESCPYIFAVVDAKYFEDRDSLLVMNEYMPKGSLRDKLLGVKPFHHLTRSPKSKKIECGKALSPEKIFAYTKQLLMGLIFLDKLHYPLKKTYLWLHAGNIMVDGKLCKLSGYEEELFRTKELTELKNDDRAGLADVGQVIFEMATGFPVNYAENINLDPGRKRLTLRRKERLKDIHFEYLKVVTPPEILQLVQFLCDEDKCASLHMAVHHPLFDQVDHIQLVEPEDATVKSLTTLYQSLSEEATKSRKEM